MTGESRHHTCGRCGVYRHLHPTARCTRPRLSFWWDRHSPVRAAAGTVWLALPEKVRWSVVRRMSDRRPELCWCDFVDAAMLDSKKRTGDFDGRYGCHCDVPLPTDVRPPRPGECYCPPWVVAP
jgi:hypothetical protein